jgi:type IV pilus assembly protein PilA
VERTVVTLIEVIVVLVILAILAAIAIPALTGYINKANSRAVISEARTVGVALQAAASDGYANNYTAGSGSYTDPAYTGAGAPTTTFGGIVNELSGATIAGTYGAITYEGAKLKTFDYFKDGYTVEYRNGKYTVK